MNNRHVVISLFNCIRHVVVKSCREHNHTRAYDMWTKYPHMTGGGVRGNRVPSTGWGALCPETFAFGPSRTWCQCRANKLPSQPRPWGGVVDNHSMRKHLLNIISIIVAIMLLIS